MTRIYIASFFNTKERLLPERDKLNAAGHEVISSWLKEVPNPTLTPKDYGTRYATEELIGYAYRDFGEISIADVLIIDTIDETPRGGREVELGFALAHKLFVIRVGPVRNVFHYLVNQAFDSWSEAHEFLNREVME